MYVGFISCSEDALKLSMVVYRADSIPLFALPSSVLANRTDEGLASNIACSFLSRMRKVRLRVHVKAGQSDGLGSYVEYKART